MPPIPLNFISQYKLKFPHQRSQLSINSSIKQPQMNTLYAPLVACPKTRVQSSASALIRVIRHLQLESTISEEHIELTLFCVGLNPSGDPVHSCFLHQSCQTCYQLLWPDITQK